MGFIIDDGSGIGGGSAKVFGGKLHTFSLLEYPIEAFSHRGKVFSIPTDFIALTTTASYSGIIYLTNTSTTEVLHIQGFRSSSTGNTLWKIIKNPTTGTLISGGIIISPVTQNLFYTGGSFTGVIKKGADALTVTDGTLMGQYMTTAYNPFVNLDEGSIILGQNNSLAVMCQPTVAGSVGCTIKCWFEDPESER